MPKSRPLDEFITKLTEFADGKRRGIRNPFVMAPCAPEVEDIACDWLEEWAAEQTMVTTIKLDELLPKTKVFKTSVAFAHLSTTEDIRRTMHSNLSHEIVELVVETLEDEVVSSRESIILLLRLGSLYPFARASQLLDELDRRYVKATIGLPFPGEIIAGKLSFYGEEARHYYPAHLTETQIKDVHLQ